MNIITAHVELSSKSRIDKRYDILLRLTMNRRMKRISSKILVNKSDFVSKAKHGQWVRQSDTAYAKKNILIKDILHRAESASTELVKNGITPTLESVANYLKGKGAGKEVDFVTYAIKVTDELKSTEQVNTYKC